MERISPSELKPRVIEAKLTGLVLFSADWCAYCMAFKKVCEKAKEKGIPIIELVLNDPSDRLWEEYRIRVLPTILAFKEGIQIARRDGRLGEGLDERDLLDVMRALGNSYL